MGSALIKATPKASIGVSDPIIPPLLYETQIFATWTLNDVKKLWRCFQTQVFGFALVEAQFEMIISATDESVAEHVPLNKLFEILDNDNDGRMDGLEFLGGLLLCCNATFEEKSRFCFEMFDFNLNSSLSDKELVMMITSCVCGMNILTGGQEELEPDISIVESIVKDAFIKADSNQNGAITFEEFTYWARTNREIMAALEKLNQLSLDARNDIDTDDSADEIDEGDLSDTQLDIGSVTKFTKKKSNDATTNQWLNQIQEPTNYKYCNDDIDGPHNNLLLDWVIGYKGNHSRNNVRFININNNIDSQLIIYVTASLAIVYDTEKKEQTYYQGHNFEITCLAIHPSGNIVATADIKSSIHIWNATTKSCNLVINCMIKEGIQHLCISPSGNQIACVGLDNDHSIILYNFMNGDFISSSKGISSPNNIYGISYSNKGTEIAIVGRKGVIKFLTGVHTTKRTIDSHYGKIGKKGKKLTFLCVVYMNDDPIVGCASGEIYRFKTGHCVQIIQGHGRNDCILSLYYSSYDNTLISGGRDSLVKTWDSTLQPVGVPIDISEDLDGDGKADSGTINSQVISVQHAKNRVLLSTKGGDIYLANLSSNPRENHSLIRIAFSHPFGILYGLSIHPSRDEFATCSDDKTIRLWSLRSHEQVNIRILPSCGRAVSYNFNGEVIAIGMYDGSVGLMEATSVQLKVYQTINSTTEPISVLAFSNDNTFLSIGSDDGNIYLYNSTDKKKYQKLAVCRGHDSPITSIDYSSNLQFIQSNGSNGSLLWWDFNGNLVKNMSSLRDLKFTSVTSLYNWGTQGIWSDTQKFPSCCLAIPDLQSIIVGDDCGHVKLFRYPSISKDSLFQSYIGHSGAIQSIKITNNRRYIITIGGLDRTIIIWKHSLQLINESEPDDVVLPKNTDYKIYDKEIPPLVIRSKKQESICHNISIEDIISNDASDLLLPKTTYNAQWKSSILEPCLYKPTSSSICESTDVDLELFWIHGHRSFDSRNNIYYSGSGSIVYTSGLIPIVYNYNNNVQKFLSGSHMDEITTLTCHPNGHIFASGDIGLKPSICIWDSVTMKVLNRFQGIHKYGIAHLAFSKKGNYLASIGQDSNNTLILHDWVKGLDIVQIPTSKNKIFSLAFMSFNNSQYTSDSKVDITYPDDIFITVGINHIKFYWINGQNVQIQNGVWERETPELILCVASASPNVCVTGSTSGKILIWKNFKVETNVYYDSSITKETYPHTSAISCIHPIEGNVISLSNDSQLNLFNHIKEVYNKLCKFIVGDLNGIFSIWVLYDKLLSNSESKVSLICMKSFNMSTLSPKSFNSTIKSINERDGMIVIGTKGGEIYEVCESNIHFLNQELTTSSFTKSMTVSKVDTNIISHRLISNHFVGEVWGLTTHPFLSIFFTSGDDRTLRCWNLVDNYMICYVNLPEKCRSIDINPSDASVIALGFNNGDVWIIPLPDVLNPRKLPSTIVDKNLKGDEIVISDSIPKSTNAQFATEKYVIPKGSTQWIQVLKFSFDGSFLVVGSHDNKIYIYDIIDNVKFNYKLVATCVGHATAVTSMDIGVFLSSPNIKSTNTNFSNDTLQIDLIISKTTETKSIIEKFNNETNGIDQIERVVIITESNTSPVVTTTNTTDKIIGSRKIDKLKDFCIQSCSLSYELLYWHINGNKIESSAVVKDAWWSTWTIPIGWPVQGLWSNNDDNVEITAVARSHSYNDIPVLATADEFGRVRIYNYPCLVDGAPDKCYRGHSNNITNLKFSYDDAYCITIGATDKSIYIWKTDILDEIRETQSISLRGSQLNKDEKIIVSSYDNSELVEFNRFNFSYIKSKEELIKFSKDWLGSIREPTSYKDFDENNNNLHSCLELNYLYGYRGWDCRNNIGYAENYQSIVYHITNVGIVFNYSKNAQVHNNDHKNDIICLAIDPSGHSIVTGEIGDDPRLIIWDSNTGVTIKSILFHKRGISHVKYGINGTNIISIGLDDDHTIAVHNSLSGNLTYTGKCGRGINIFGMATSVLDNRFATCGNNHIKFWDFPSNLATGGELSSKTGIYSIKAIACTVPISLGYLGNDAVTGMIDGSIILWKDRLSNKFKVAHSGPVTSICSVVVSKKNTPESSEIGPRIATGGKDGFIHIWNEHIEIIWTLDLNTSTPLSIIPIIQALDVRDNHMLIGTKSSELYDINIDTSELNRLIIGHYDDVASSELNGLSIHPNIHKFVTCCDDMTVRLWDSKVKIQAEIIQLDSQLRCICYSPEGDQIAVGTVDGRLKVLSSDLSIIIKDLSISLSEIQVLKYSPNGLYLCIGCSDCSIYILDSSMYSCLSKCSGHRSAICNIDFSIDSMFIVSCSKILELFYWTIQGQQIKSINDIKDLKFHSLNCIVGWALKGIWEDKLKENCYITTADKSSDNELIAVGDNKGVITIYKYPSPKAGAVYREYKGHSEGVREVRFSSDNKYLFSIGGIDKSIFQYEIKSPK